MWLLCILIITIAVIIDILACFLYYRFTLIKFWCQSDVFFYLSGKNLLDVIQLSANSVQNVEQSVLSLAKNISSAVLAGEAQEDMQDLYQDEDEDRF